MCYGDYVSALFQSFVILSVNLLIRILFNIYHDIVHNNYYACQFVIEAQLFIILF